MLRFFFYRTSFMVYLMNFISFVEILVLFHLEKESRGAGPLGWASGFLIFSWIFFNLLNVFPWYPGKKGKLGIRLHFQKNLVPISYICAIAFVFKIAGVSEWALFPFAVLMIPIYYVTFILLYFHFRDSSRLTPGYFTHNFYLRKEEK